jgi:hypothetical protein
MPRGEVVKAMFDGNRRFLTGSARAASFQLGRTALEGSSMQCAK